MIAKLLSDTAAKLILVLAVTLFLAGSLWYSHHAGYKDAEALWSAKYDRLVADTKASADAEAQRQAQVNLKAQTEMARTVAVLNEQVAQRGATIKELQDEAANDPDAGRMCLSVDGVRRLNRAASGRR